MMSRKWHENVLVSLIEYLPKLKKSSENQLELKTNVK